MQLTSDFTRESSPYSLEILLDAGQHRHLRGHNPADPSYRFDVITAPTTLLVRCGGPSFVFDRAEKACDMLDLFRYGVHADGSLQINPGYWAQKLSASLTDVLAYSQEKFEAYVRDALDAGEQRWPGATAAWLEHAGSYNLEDEESARAAVAEFEFGATRRFECACGQALALGQGESLALEWHQKHVSILARRAGHGCESTEVPGFAIPCAAAKAFEDYTPWYLFACSAVVWAAAAYDKAKAAVPHAAAAAPEVLEAVA